MEVRKDGWAGGARSSSARDLNCSLKWGNERNPCRVLQVSHETALFLGEEGRDDVRSACPFDTLGHTHATMVATMGLPSREAELIPQTRPQFGLKAATRLHEAGIASNRASAMAR